VQGVAEVVPVSSSAQLTLVPYLLGWQPEPDRTTFAASLHAGSAVGIYLAVRHDLQPGTAKRSLAFAAPAAVAGALAHKQVERRLGGVAATAALLAVAGAALWAADRRPSDRALTTSALNAASLAQVAALAPGVSRSGATLTALRAQRVDREEALRHTLHSSLPITVGAAALTALRARKAPELLPTLAAAGAAFAAAKAVKGGSQRLIAGAAIYRLAVAGLTAVHLRRERHS
jgi:undecaprenyl-diphosphatase